MPVLHFLVNIKDHLQLAGHLPWNLDLGNILLLLDGIVDRAGYAPHLYLKYRTELSGSHAHQPQVVGYRHNVGMYPLTDKPK